MAKNDKSANPNQSVQFHKLHAIAIDRNTLNSAEAKMIAAFRNMNLEEREIVLEISCAFAANRAAEKKAVNRHGFRLIQGSVNLT